MQTFYIEVSASRHRNIMKMSIARYKKICDITRSFLKFHKEKTLQLKQY